MTDYPDVTVTTSDDGATCVHVALDPKHVRLAADPEREPERRVNVTISDVFAVPDEYGFLRINVGPETATIDPDARNVTVTDVPDVPADDLPGEPVEPGDLTNSGGAA